MSSSFCALLGSLDLAQLRCRDIVVEKIQALVIGEEQRGVAAAARCRIGAAAAARVGRGRRQVPECETGESGAGTDQKRFLELAQRQRSVRGSIAERSLGHLEAETEAARTAAIKCLEQWMGPDLVKQSLIQRCRCRVVLIHVLTPGKFARGAA